MKTPFHFSLLVSCLVWSATAKAFCFAEAEAIYGMPDPLLRAIARVESGGNHKAINKNKHPRTGKILSEDIGVMQINSLWLPILAKHRITRDSLIDDPCLNVKVGAWILSGNVARKGYGWDAIGAFNAGCKGIDKTRCANLRNRYANRVYSTLKRFESGQPTQAPAKPADIKPVADVLEAGITHIQFGDNT